MHWKISQNKMDSRVPFDSFGVKFQKFKLKLTALNIWSSGHSVKSGAKSITGFFRYTLHTGIPLSALVALFMSLTNSRKKSLSLSFLKIFAKFNLVVSFTYQHYPQETRFPFAAGNFPFENTSSRRSSIGLYYLDFGHKIQSVFLNVCNVLRRSAEVLQIPLAKFKN